MLKLTQIIKSYRLILFIFGISFILFSNLKAGFEDLPTGARSLGMGATYVALANTADAIFLNPGGLSQLLSTEISLFYQKPFGLKDLHFGTAAISAPVWGRRLSVGFLTFGNSIYKEQMIAIAYSHHYRQKLYYSVCVRYQRLQIEDYGSTGKPGIDLGLLVPITPHISWGFLAKNINRPEIGREKERIPQSFKTGFSTQPVANLILNLEIFKDVRFTGEVRFGAEFKPFDNLALRIGTANNPSRFSAGFGIKVQPFTVDYAFFTHNDLGLTHQMSISFILGKTDR